MKKYNYTPDIDDKNYLKKIISEKKYIKNLINYFDKDEKISIINIKKYIRSYFKRRKYVRKFKSF